MLRMPSKIRTSLLICFLVVGAVSSASGTCADSLVRAYGEIEGEIGPNSKITIDISPNPAIAGLKQKPYKPKGPAPERCQLAMGAPPALQLALREGSTDTGVIHQSGSLAAQP
jgi:hypothetical protein